MAKDESQRREMVRVDDVLEISHKTITPAEKESLGREIIDRSSGGGGMETVASILQSAGRTVDPDAPFTRGELTDFLQSKNVETRPVMSGNMAEQPVMEAYAHRVQGDLPTSRVIMRDSFYFGNHHEVGPEQRAAIGDYLDEFFARYASP